MGKFLRLTEAVNHLKRRGFYTTKGTLCVWRSQGAGPPSRKINGKIVYKQTDLDSFVDNEIGQPHQRLERE